MSVYNFANSVVAGSAGQSTGFYPKTLEGSLRFNDDDSAYLSWTPASAGNRKTWTWSAWVKRGNLGVTQFLFGGGDSTRTDIYFDDDDNFNIAQYQGMQLEPNQVFRDPSAWYHIVISIDTTQATEANRASMYINGVKMSSFKNETYPSQNADLGINDSTLHRLGARAFNTSNTLDAYLAEVHFTDGTAYDADAFGEFKEGVWVAKTPSVTYGTNGFHLTFQDDTEVEAFNTVLYRGSGSQQSITGMGFKPDLIWLKQRNGTGNHWVVDAVRGRSVGLYPESTSAEVTSSSTQDILSFDSDGFTLGTSYGATTNTSGAEMVAWGWKAGDSNVSNTAGSIPSTVRANDTYGFSIVSYTGTGSSGTIGHGLSTAPAMIITKDRESATQEWTVYHKDLTAGYSLFLNTTDAQANRPQDYTTTAPTTSVYSVGGGNPTSGLTDDYIAYCWAEKAGYSKFGSYEGSNSAVNVTGLGFTPAFVLIKAADTVQSWVIFDNTRDVPEPQTNVLFPDGSFAEESNPSNRSVSFTSDGFTVNSTTNFINGSGNGTFIYAAFADTREAAFWLDQSGNDNDWQPVNLDHNDTVADSPTNNFCTMNPIAEFGTPSAFTLADGNLDLTFTSTSGNDSAVGTMGLTSGKWYHEVTLVSHADDSNAGFTTAEALATETTTDGAAYYKSVGYHRGDRAIIWGTEPTPTQRFTVLSDGDVLGFALDLDSTPQTLKIYLNGGASPIVDVELPTDKGDTWIPCCGDDGGDAGRFIFNFGQQPFKYDPPE